MSIGIATSDSAGMPKLAIRCHRCAPLDTEEVERWLDGEVERLRAASPQAVLRLVRLTQETPTREIHIGWMVELENDADEPPLEGEDLTAILRDLRLIGLQPTVLRAADPASPAPSLAGLPEAGAEELAS